jgi:hypothetical protein
MPYSATEPKLSIELSINPDEPESCLHVYGNHILTDMSDKQIVIDGKKQRGVSPVTRGNSKCPGE